MKLTPREADVLRECIKGGTRKEIGLELKISPMRVSNILRNVYDKTGMSNRLELQLWWLKGGCDDYGPR